jgi:hypothetical protein
MNKKLKENCIKNGYLFVDVFDKYCDKDGFMNPEYKDVTVHITNGVFINEFLKNNLKWN